MDKATPKSDLFKANRDRAAPLLEKLKADGIGSIDEGRRHRVYRWSVTPHPALRVDLSQWER